MSFVHLHVHSTYSDGVATPEELVVAAKARGYTALAKTDHNTVEGWLAFLDATTKHHITPILGAECAVKSQLGIGHLIILASSPTGFRMLQALTKQRTVIQAPQIASHPDLYVTSSCLGGLVAGAFKNHDYWAARDTAVEYRELFGPRYYLEVQPSFGTILPWVLALGRDLAIPVIATNDVHYLGLTDETNQVGLHLATEQEMRSYSPFTGYQGALENAGDLAQILTAYRNTTALAAAG